MNEIIKESDIRKKCALDTTFSKGNKLFNNDSVYQMDMEVIKEDLVEIRATVEGSRKRDYEVWFQLELDPVKNKISSCSCHCEAYQNYGGICKHLTAAMLELNYQINEWELQDMLEMSVSGDVFELVGEDTWYESGNEQEYDEPLLSPAILKQFKDMDNFMNQNNYPSSNIATSSGRTFTTRIVEETSRPLMDTMSAIVLKEHSRFCVENVNGDIELEPTLIIEAAEEKLEFRIGKKQKYVVKSINQLIENIKKQAFVKYGKNLEFVHTQSAFSKESQQMIALIMNANIPTQSNYYGYYSRSNVRSMEMDAYMLDELIQLYEGRKLYIETPLAYNKELTPVVRENPVLPLIIEAMDSGRRARLQFPKILLLEGSRNIYIYWNATLFICSSDYENEMKEIAKLMSYNWTRDERGSGFHSYMGKNQQVQELCEKDYISFCTTMLPILEKYMDVQVKNIDFSNYQIEEGSYELYFDLRNKNDVVCNAKAKYGDKEHNLLKTPQVTETYRDYRMEYELRTLLSQYLPEKTQNGQEYLLRNDDDRLAALIEDGIEQLKNMAEVYVSDEFKKIRIASHVSVNTGLSIKGNLLNVSWDISGMLPDELTDILGAYRRKKKYHRLRNGELLNLSESGLDTFADMQEDLQLTKAQLKAGMAEVPLYRALYIDALMHENADRIRVTRDEAFITLTERFEQVKDKRYDLPEEVTAELRPYQMEGYQWIRMLAELGFGGILADDMGLGKTVQIISYICSVKKETHLVVCPASLVYNWEAEFNKFAPSMRVCLMVGTALERKELIDHMNDYDVVVTSYDLLKRDIELYTDKKFGCEIIDEAQYIKNPETQASKAVKIINSQVRFALTGTPIENRLSELWSIFEYLMPGYLYSYKHFKEQFEENIIQGTKESEQKALARLHNMIRPFLLRRLKQDVLKELPDKMEEVIYSRFSKEQEKLYKAAEKNILDSLNKKSNQEFKENKLQILAEITKLRQICCDPALLYDNYKHGSAKLDTCLEMIESAIEGGQRILLFSQFASMLDILAERLREKHIRYFQLTGSTSKAKRRTMVDQFQQNKAEVFLISLKAGGTGLNLTAADMVIHYDPWWNVAAQNQATDRAHRIGQENRVTVMKLIARNTIEERILKLQEMKKDLADKIISEEGMSLAAMSKEELLSLFM